MNKLYVSGLWIVKDWDKKTPEVYMKCLKNTLKMLEGQNLLFLSNADDLFEFVKQESASHKIKLITINKEFQDLPAWDISIDYVNACQRMELNVSPKSSWKNYQVIKEKGLKHYFRDFDNKNVESYRSALAIWLSKIPLVSEIISQQNFSDFNQFAWCDASISRFNSKRIKSDFTNQADREFKISHYYSGMNYFTQKIIVSASYLSGDRTAWGKLYPMYDKYLQTLRKFAYAHDEETIISHCFEECQELFHLINPGQRKANRKNINKNK